MFTNGTIGLEDLKVLYKNATGFNKEVKYRVLTNQLPSRYLYLKISLQEDIIGGILRDNFL